MRQANVYYKGERAGVLIQDDQGKFTFRYLDSWISDDKNPAISLRFPKANREYHSDYLFPFFYNMLPEGTNKAIVCKHMKIDTDDYFGLLLTTAVYDTIGAITITKIEE